MRCSRSTDVERVLIVDWDVHHGNGTQHMFEDDPSVFYFSIHEWPYYPGTGAAAERGRGAGEGTTLERARARRMGRRRVPPDLPRRCCARTRLEFDPDFVLVSAGFDAHAADPLAGMRVTRDGLPRHDARRSWRSRDECCDGGGSSRSSRAATITRRCPRVGRRAPRNA